MKFILLFITLTITSHSALANKDNYIIKVDHINKILNIKSCFTHAPDYLYTISNNAEKIIHNIKWQQKPIRHYQGYIYLPQYKSGCVSYSVDGSKLRGMLNNNRINEQHPKDTVLEISDFLWKRNDYNQYSEITVTFLHDHGINISAPWSLISRENEKTTYLITYTPMTWVGYVGFGEIDIIELDINDAKINLAIVKGNNSYNQSSLINWINQMASAVALISNGFPVKEVQIMVYLLKGNSEAVPWGQVNRYGGPGVFFVVNPEKSHQELINDWTAAHEFSHFLLPYTPDDRWLAEGFASYHQNISRARAGLLDETSTWKKLIAGFKRGQNTANKKYAPHLKYAKSRNRMQMYWGGAVIALIADVELQNKTDGLHTLSSALAKLSQCCLNSSNEWTASETFARLDKITNTDIFSNLYEKVVKKSNYPDYQELLKDLGIRQMYTGQIILDDTAINASIRKKIING